MLPEYFDYPIVVANYADSCESSGSFLGNPKLMGAVTSHWVAGDYLIVQSGHNDGRERPEPEPRSLSAKASAPGGDLAATPPTSGGLFGMATPRTRRKSKSAAWP